MAAAESEHGQRTYRMCFWSLLGMVTLARLALAGSLGLGVDESHYVLYARHLAWGYVDHPPMVAWLAALGALAAETPFYFRLIPILFNAFSVVLLRRLALHLWSDERIAFWALVILTLLPYQHLLLVALLPDAGLNLFWCATLVSFRRSLINGRWLAWGGTGLLAGAAMLAKYHALMLPICLGGYLLASSTHRHWLRRFQPYAAVLIALAVYSPNLIWNAENGWISYRFHLGRAGSGGFDAAAGLAGIGGQLAAWSPLLFALLVAAFLEIVRRRPVAENMQFVLWCSLPVFACFIGIGFLGKTLPHWTSPGWWCGSLALTSVALSKVSGGGRSAVYWRRSAFTGAVIALLMTTCLYVGLYRPVVEPIYNHLRSASLRISRRLPAIKPLPAYQPKFDVSNDLFGWRETANEVQSVLQRMRRPHQTFIFTHRFFEASQLAVYLPVGTSVTTLGRKTDQYRLWFDPAVHLGWDAVFVDVDRRSQRPDRYLPLFQAVQPGPDVLLVRREGRQIRKIRLYRFVDYKGGYQN